MAALFGNSASSRNQSKNLVEFRAGKMHMKGKMVHPDKRKGLVYVYQSDDSLMHFCWKDRTTGAVEDDLIIFPDDIEFKHVSQCTTGRVYVLKFKSSSRKFFFWLQEPKTEKDEENCKKVNDFLNNPPTPGSSRGGGSGGLPSDLSNLGEQDLQSILGGMSQQQLMQLLGGIGMGGSSSPGVLGSLIGRPSSAQSTVSEPPLPMRTQSASGARATSGDTTPSQPRPVAAAALPSQLSTAGDAPTTTAAGGTATSGMASTASAGASAQIQLSDLQNILSSMNVPAEGAGKEGIDLAKALSPEAMIPILANAGVQERLIPYLPEGESLPKTEEELRNTVQSPQFQQALSSFSSALQSGQLGPLMSQFGLGEAVANAAAQGDMEAFVKAMQEATKKKDGDGDDSMEHWPGSGWPNGRLEECLYPQQLPSKQDLIHGILVALRDECSYHAFSHYFHAEFGHTVISDTFSEATRDSKLITSHLQLVDMLKIIAGYETKNRSLCHLSKLGRDQDIREQQLPEWSKYLQPRSISPSTLAPEEFEFVSPSVSEVGLSGDAGDSEMASHCAVKMIVTSVEEICCQDSEFPITMGVNSSALSGAKCCTASRDSESNEHVPDDSLGALVTEGQGTLQEEASHTDHFEEPEVHILHFAEPTVSLQNEGHSSFFAFINEAFGCDVEEDENRVEMNRKQTKPVDEDDPNTSNTNDDMRDQGAFMECVDHLQNDKKDIIHLEFNADTNEDDREVCHKMIGFDHLSREGMDPCSGALGRSLDPVTTRKSAGDVSTSGTASHCYKNYPDTPVVVHMENTPRPSACTHLDGHNYVSFCSVMSNDEPALSHHVPVVGNIAEDGQYLHGSRIGGQKYRKSSSSICPELRDFEETSPDCVDQNSEEDERKGKEHFLTVLPGHSGTLSENDEGCGLKTLEVLAEDNTGYKVKREMPFHSLEEHAGSEVSCDSPFSERSKDSDQDFHAFRPLAFMRSNSDLSSVVEVKAGHDDSQEDVRKELLNDTMSHLCHMTQRPREDSKEVNSSDDFTSDINIENGQQVLKWCEKTNLFENTKFEQVSKIGDDNIDEIYQEVCNAGLDDAYSDMVFLVQDEDDISEQEDTNEDVRDIRSACTDVEEIDHLAKNVLEDDTCSTAMGQQRDSNEDMRPVSDDFTAFDHLDGAIIDYEDQPQCKAEPRQAERDKTDTTFIFHLERNDIKHVGSVKIDVEIKGNLSGSTKEEDIIIMPVAYKPDDKGEIYPISAQQEHFPRESGLKSDNGPDHSQMLNTLKSHQDTARHGYDRLEHFRHDTSNLNNCEETSEQDSSSESYDKLSQPSSTSEVPERFSQKSSDSEGSSSLGVGDKVVAEISNGSIAAQPLLCREDKIGLDSEDEQDLQAGTDMDKEHPIGDLNSDGKTSHVYSDELYTFQGARASDDQDQVPIDDREESTVQRTNDDQYFEEQDRSQALPEIVPVNSQAAVAESRLETSARDTNMAGYDSDLGDDQDQPVHSRERERKISIPDVSVKLTFSGGEIFVSSLEPVPLDGSGGVSYPDVEPDESMHLGPPLPLDMEARGDSVSEQEAPGVVESTSELTQSDKVEDQAGPSSTTALQSGPSQVRNRKLKPISLITPGASVTKEDHSHDVVHSSSCTSRCNQTTVVSSPRVDLPCRRVDADIAVEKVPPCTFLGRKNQEQGESFSLLERGRQETVSTEMQSSQVVPTVSGHDIVANESQGHASFRASHQVTYNDMLACAVSFVDVLFWVCLAMGVIIVEFCHVDD